MPIDYEAILIAQYRATIEKYGPRIFYSKSHWDDCDRAGSTSAVMPSETPAKWISCNTCLIRRGYIRFVHCEPWVRGWPRDDRDCEKCEHGIDCETWLRVRGVVTGVEEALRRIDPDADHPVTWAETGLIPFKDWPDPEFEGKASLDAYCAKLLSKYPEECAYLVHLRRP